MSLLKSEDISAVVVTKGDHPSELKRIIESLPFNDIYIWNNSTQTDAKVFGRYMGMLYTQKSMIYVQDDDCLIPRETIEDLIETKRYAPQQIVASMPEDHGDYTDSVLVGWGAIFERHLPWEAFVKFSSRFDPLDADYFRTCDVVFTTLTPFTRIKGEHYNFDFAYGEDRMYNQSDHDVSRETVLNQARMVRDNPIF